MSNKINQALENLGFNEREIKIYLNLISEQNLTVLQISKRTNIDRTTIYDLLEKLMNKGIVSFFLQNNVKHFKALVPKKLADYFMEKYSSLENVLPDLNNITDKSKEIVRCELFQGVNGLKVVLKELLESNLEYKVIGIRKEYEEILSYFNDSGILKAEELKVKEKAIIERGSIFTKTKNGMYRYLDKDSLPPVTTLIYKNVVLFLIWKEPYFVIRIENKDFTKTQEEYFNLMWKIAKTK